MIAFFASWILKASALLALGLLCLLVFRRISSSLRHHILTASLLGAIAIGPLSFVAPAIYVGITVEWPQKLSPITAPRADRPQPIVLPNEMPADVPALEGRSRVSAAAALLLWLIPAFLLLLRAFICRGRLSLTAGRKRPFSARVVARVAEDVVVELGLSRPVRILEGPQLSVPFAFGLWRPTVMLPLEASSWSRERLKLVLVHEMMHIRRMDSASLLLAEIACALFWFNPLAWAAARQLKLECERACDEQVLATMVTPKAYANCLIAAARDSLLPQSAAPFGGIAILTAGELESRLRYIMATSVRPRKRWTKSRPYVALASLPVALSVSALHAQAPSDEGASVRLAPVSIQASFAMKPKFSNWIDDPRSELLPAVAATSIDIADFSDPRERAAVEKLVPTASHKSEAYDDLVGERGKWALAQASDGAIIEPLIAKLGSSDWRERAYSAWALTVARDARGVEPMRPLLNDSVWRVRMQAAFGLLALGAPLDRETATRLSEDTAWQVRMAVVEHLERMPRAWSIQILSELARDKHNGTRMAAAAALEKAQRL